MRGSVAFTTNFLDRRSSAAAWITIPDRAVTHVKLSPTSIIRVTYMDTIGWSQQAKGYGCIWRMLTDGAALNRENWTYTDSLIGWRIFPVKMVYFPNVGVGSHTYIMQYYNYGSNECLAGYPGGATVNSMMIVEELEPRMPYPT